MQVLEAWLVVAATITHGNTQQMTSVIVATPWSLGDRLAATGKHLLTHSRKVTVANNEVAFPSGIQ